MENRNAAVNNIVNSNSIQINNPEPQKSSGGRHTAAVIKVHHDDDAELCRVNRKVANNNDDLLSYHVDTGPLQGSKTGEPLAERDDELWVVGLP